MQKFRVSRNIISYLGDKLMKAGMFSFIVMPLVLDWSVDWASTVYIGEEDRQLRCKSGGSGNHDFRNHIRPPPLLLA